MPDHPIDLQPLDSSVVPRYAEVATFLRAPRVDDLDIVDIGIFGVPVDTATFRGGTREGPARCERPHGQSAG